MAGKLGVSGDIGHSVDVAQIKAQKVKSVDHPMSVE